MLNFQNQRGQEKAVVRVNAGLIDRSALLQQSGFLNTSHLSKNTYMRKLNDPQEKSQLGRFQGPPSHSRILQFADLDEYTQSLQQDESTMYKDEEVSKIFQDKFNRSLIEPTQKRQQDRSYVIMNTSHLRPERQADKSQIFKGNESLGNIEDSQRLSNKSIENPQKKVRDVSQIYDVSALLGNSMLLGSNLNDVSDLNEPTVLERLSASREILSTEQRQSESKSKIDDYESPMQPQQHYVPFVDREKSMHVIWEESRSELNETNTMDQNKTNSHEKTDMQNRTIISDTSSKFNQVIGFFDQIHIDHSRIISQKQEDEEVNNTQKLFLENKKRLDLLQTLEEKEKEKKNDSIDSKKKTSKLIKPTKIKPSESQKKKLLDQRRNIKNKQKADQDKSLQSIRERSKTIQPPPNSDSKGRSQRSATIYLNPGQTNWQEKFNVITDEKKNWLVERKQLKTEIFKLQEKNFNLETRIRELTKTLDFAQNYMQANEISQIQAHNLNATQFTQVPMLEGLNDMSQISQWLPRLSGGNQRPQNAGGRFYDYQQPGMNDETIIMHAGHSFDLKSASKSMNHTQLDQVRREMALNIQELQMQNRLAEDNIMHNSLLLQKAMENSVLEAEHEESRLVINSASREDRKKSFQDVQNANRQTPGSQAFGSSNKSPTMANDRPQGVSMSFNQQDLQGDQDEVLLNSATPVKHADLDLRASNRDTVRHSEHEDPQNDRSISKLLRAGPDEQEGIQLRIKKGNNQGFEQAAEPDGRLPAYQNLFSYFKGKKEMSPPGPYMVADQSPGFKADTPPRDSLNVRTFPNASNDYSAANTSNLSSSAQKQVQSANVRMTAGFGMDALTPDMLASLTNQHNSLVASSAHSSSASQARGRGDPAPQTGRITFNPGDFEKLTSNLDASSQHLAAEKSESFVQSQQARDRSKELSIDFLNILNPTQAAGMQRNSNPRNSNEGHQSFLSAIHRDKDASYLMNPNISLNITNASFVTPNLSQVHGFAPGPTGHASASFLHGKVRPIGQSKLKVPDYDQTNLPTSELHGRNSEDASHAHDLHDLEFQQEVIREQVVRQRLLQQQVLDQQNQLLLLGHHTAGSFSQVSGQESVQYQSQLLCHQIQQQQELLRQSQIRRQRLTLGMDKAQIKDQFLSLKGVGRQSAQARPTKDEAGQVEARESVKKEYFDKFMQFRRQ